MTKLMGPQNSGRQLLPNAL